MSMDFDDYFPDDFDEQTIAALDQVEQSYFAAESSKKNVQSPPPKRQKTEHGWTHATSSTPVNQAATSFGIDELPEISVSNDAYAFNPDEFASTPRLQTQNKQPQNQFKPPPSIPPPTSASHLNAARNNASQAPAFNRRPSSSSSHSGSIHLSQRQQSARSSTSRASRMSIIASALGTSSSVTSAPPVTTPGGTPSQSQGEPNTPIAPPLDETQIQNQLTKVMAELEELRNQNAKIQNDLKDAQDARLAKEGEVTVLRKGMERTAQEHARQIAQLNATKEELVTQKDKLDKDWKSELERVKTQYAFRQHEMESNAKKPPPSARQKNRYPSQSQFPSSQTPISRVIFTGSGPNTQSQSTPLRNTKSSRPQKSPDVSRKSAMLPGFENAFSVSTPKRASKIQPNPIPVQTQSEPEFAVPLPPKRLFAEEISHHKSSPPGDDSMSVWEANEDFPMLDAFDARPQADSIQQGQVSNTSPDLEDDELIENFVFFSRKAELTRLLLIHVFPSSGISTLQILAEAASKVSSTSRDTFSLPLSRILGIISDTTVDADYELVVSSLSRELLHLSLAMNQENLTKELTSLLNLITMFSYTFPHFATSLLSHLHKEDDTTPDVIVLFCDIVQQRFTPIDEQGLDRDFVHQVLSLLEVICRTASDDTHLLEAITSNAQVLKLLLDPSQPPWFLARSTRLLLLLYAFPGLRRVTFSFEEANGEEKIYLPPHLDNLCVHLTDNRRWDADSSVAKSNSLASFTLLSLANLNTSKKLALSFSLIPSLVVYLTQLTTPLWEEDETLLSSPKDISTRIRATLQTISLIHHLIFNTDSDPLNFRKLLQETQSSRFAGIIHMFIVTFGRLSYAQDLEWMDDERRREMTGVYELASELFDLVVDGPEGDSVYAAFQDQGEEGNIDEGEIENFFG
ncbi:hypothetical protein K435DRAFT_963088 [Dendrothele bispora CBS 962.96]|uniref:Uncharacterized protein n=1 Tax=Dendrothele bispora (strain CBS 962.96) TaxID=1314807 RepID=A0A4S8MI22_DENBC|nr:hypothetical protein K435DRAFT_963088 [Dendrothele bispora CBS 962.96]